MPKISQNISNGSEKRTEAAAVREKAKRKSSTEDVLPYDGMRVAVFQNKKQHIVHCGKCLGRCSGVESVVLRERYSVDILKCLVVNQKYLNNLHIIRSFTRNDGFLTLATQASCPV